MADTQISATGSNLSSSLCLITEGTGATDRIGKNIFIRNVYLRGKVHLPSTDDEDDTAQRVRIIVYIDSQHNQSASAPALNLLLQKATVDGFYNLEETGRFKYISDKIYTLNSGAGAPAGGGGPVYGTSVRTWKCNFNMNQKITYNGVGALDDLTNNNIGVYAVCDGITTSAPEVSYEARIRYTD